MNVFGKVFAGLFISSVIGAMILLVIQLVIPEQREVEPKKEDPFCYLENADSVQTAEIMAKPNVYIKRLSMENDKVLLQFNEESSRLLKGLSLNFEETSNGILITVPMVDVHKASKITYKKRKLEFELFNEFHAGWFPIVKLDKGKFLVEIDFE